MKPFMAAVAATLVLVGGIAQAKSSGSDLNGMTFLKVGNTGIWCESQLAATTVNLFSNSKLNGGAKEKMKDVFSGACQKVPAGTVFGVHSIDGEHGVLRVMAMPSSQGVPHDTFIYLPIQLLDDAGNVWSWVPNPDLVKELNK